MSTILRFSRYLRYQYQYNNTLLFFRRDRYKCVICQEENNEAVDEFLSANRDTQLKGAFKKAPTAVAKIKIRIERARNAHAGKYHTSCWENHIRAKPELMAVMPQMTTSTLDA